MPEHTNPVGMPDALQPDADRECYECGHAYTILGDAPGVCPACGSRAVTPAGTLTVLDVRPKERTETTVRRATTGDTAVLEVLVADETDRLLVFYVTGLDDAPTVTTARYEDWRVSIRDAEWTPALVPAVAVDAAAEHLDTDVTIGEGRDA